MKLHRHCRLIVLASLVCGMVAAAVTVVASAGDKKAVSVIQAETLFLEKVQPLLKAKCLGCHGEGDKLEGKLDLRTRARMLKGGESGEPALVPGKSAESLLYQAVQRTGDLKMPPKDKDKLTADEVTALRTWIDAGAPWAIPKDIAKKEWKSTPADTWAYRPIQRYPVPSDGLDAKQIKTPIDAFILQKLKAKKLTLAPPADRVTLIRRATLDLTGLPPTPEEIGAFVKDLAPDAFDKLIKRLLDSPRYGEQWARHWLDVVRYADTSGFSNDFERPHAWRYRDYVIRAFNEDKPFDRFIVEQLAGDELEPDNPEMLIAAGFLRMGPWEHTGMSVRAVTRQQFLDDVTNSVGVTFLAQGLRCARCHDHKFDPLPTKDYYRMQAVFAPVQFADREAVFLSAENTRGFTEAKTRPEDLIKDARKHVAGIREKHQQAIAEFLKRRGVTSINELPAGERPRQHFGLTTAEMGIEKIYRKRIEYFERELQRYQPLALGVYNGPVNDFTSNKVTYPLPKKRAGPIQDVHILKGGALESPQEKVTPGVLSAVHGSNDSAQPAAWNTMPSTMDGRRLALARWIASPNNTLTARVIVNRAWQHHFAGRGIVGTPNNFGKMGKRPTHPELLDWLATWFVDNGWSLKKLHRLIMTSAVYQQSGNRVDLAKVQTLDPNNELLAYYPQRRLAAEEMRDSMLAIAGELIPAMGGPGVFPEINWEVALQPRHIMGSVAPAYQPSPKPQQRNRRTIYAFRIRTLGDPLLEVFNRPDSDTSCERRDQTTVTPQAFALLNDQAVRDRALALARRLETMAKEPAKQIAHAYRLVYGRPPAEAEQKLCLDHLAKMTEHHRRHPPVPLKLPASVKRKMVEELTGEPFEWLEELDVLRNYQRDLQPWDVGPATRALAEVCLVLFNSNEFLYVD